MPKHRKMKTEKRQIGNLGECIGIKYLKKQGYKILERNYFKRWGEIDIIAEDKDKTLVFFEVKTRSSLDFGHPAESVTFFKQKRLVRSAYFYLAEKKLENTKFRIDVLAIIVDFQKRLGRVEHFKNAVEEIG